MGSRSEEGTPYAAWRRREPGAFSRTPNGRPNSTPSRSNRWRAGFEQYEISNFAPPAIDAHNCNYWANGEYVGLGVGAASYCDGARWVHTRSLERYVAAALAGGADFSGRSRAAGRSPPRR